MPEKLLQRKAVSNAFDKIHDQLLIIRGHVESGSDDPKLHRLVDNLDHGMLVPMRKLRLALDIPYDWHEETQREQEL
jgi:hypothetical protein